MYYITIPNKSDQMFRIFTRKLILIQAFVKNGKHIVFVIVEIRLITNRIFSTIQVQNKVS